MSTVVVFLAPHIPDTLFLDLDKALPREVVLRGVEGNDPATVREAVADADIVWTMGTPVDENVICHASKLKLVQSVSAGYDCVSLSATHRHGIPVAHCPGFNAQSVAEHVMLLVLALYRRLPQALASVRGGEWKPWELARSGLHELHGKTLGIIGLGHIGKRLALISRGFEMTVVYYDIRRLEVTEEQRMAVRFAQLGELLPIADIVSVHVPLNRETEGMIGRTFFRQMRPTAIFVNTSRGKVVQEDALVEALSQAQIAGAALDVYATEPLRLGHPLSRFDNAILTPHYAGISLESINRLIPRMVANVERVLRGETPRDVVQE